MTTSSSVIVSVSGIRGIIGQGLTPELACRFAAALGAHLGGGTVVLGRDSRPSGAMLRQAALAGLVSAGCDVQDIGIAPTPTVGLAVRHLQAVGGLQITASHNPSPWNGLKLFDRRGAVLTAADGQIIKQLFETDRFDRVPWDKLGGFTERPQADDWHCQRVLELVDVVRIRSRQIHTFLDANGGAGGPLGQALLESFQCRPVCRGCRADGDFLHPPEPLAENLADICPEVAASGAAVGFVLDPDADRLALIDETGRYVGEEMTLALAVRFRLGKERGPVVINMSTSRVVEDIAKQYGCPCHRSAVGEANVVELMHKSGAVIGGEGNGGVIDPRVGWVRDPFIGMGLILNLMAETGKQLSVLVDELPAYAIVKDKYHADRSRLPALFNAMKQRWPEATVNDLDGLRLDWPDRWVHLRSSNTEPIVRVIAEAPQRGDAEGLCRAVGDLLQ